MHRDKEGETDPKAKPESIQRQRRNSLAAYASVLYSLHFCLNLPSAVFRTFNTVLQMVYPNRPMVVTQFLWQQLLQYPYYLKSACNFFILLLGYPNFRLTIAHFPGVVIHSLRNKIRNRSGLTAISINGRDRVSIEVDPQDSEI